MILDDIVRQVAIRTLERKKAVPLETLRRRVTQVLSTRDFKGAIRKKQGDSIRVIAEVKQASPSKGVIRERFDPVNIARTYEKAGAAAISVLTEQDFFLGHPDFLSAIRKAVEIPLLRKDFITDPYQVWEARHLGADAFLLIVALLSGPELEELIQLGRELGVTALVEVHTREELDAALASSAEVIGINNRNLKTFETDLGTTSELAPSIPEGVVVVSESGIGGPQDLLRLESARVDAVLVGESLMRAPEPGEKLQTLLGYRTIP
ncbi:MAG: indole-3-glycerol phosphate synthase TrpC [bacterium]|nr:indole-3-glycerol phosphate synthase TrpC [bacterium]